MNSKKIIVPEGENPLKFLRKVRSSDAIVYLHDRLVSCMIDKGKILSNTTERLVIKFDKEEIIFNNGHNMVYHQLIKIGDKSYAPIRHDKRNTIIIFEVDNS